MRDLGEKQKALLTELTDRFPELKTIECDIAAAYEALQELFSNDGKLLIAGNGGSAADADHIVGELMKGFCKRRRITEDFVKELSNIDSESGAVLGANLQGALPAIALTNHTALSTAFANDVSGALTFAQQVYGYGKPGDVLLAISTSGNSKNVCYAAVTAKALGMKVIAFTGIPGGALARTADIPVRVPEQETYKVQELQLPIYHCWCLMLEEYFF
ncbi:MAG: SIS domain-containing protein [Clostridiales Family XIII bacterium]|jgi:D-sedoheptulose 7-phosphate isomerase|nr:SIS domain-containing protein [Clostridiales Family XIII bacterium]